MSNVSIFCACFISFLSKTIKSTGSSDGAIVILTHGRLLRKDYIKQAITTALIHLENLEKY